MSKTDWRHGFGVHTRTIECGGRVISHFQSSAKNYTITLFIHFIAGMFTKRLINSLTSMKCRNHLKPARRFVNSEPCVYLAALFSVTVGCQAFSIASRRVILSAQTFQFQAHSLWSTHRFRSIECSISIRHIFIYNEVTWFGTEKI